MLNIARSTFLLGAVVSYVSAQSFVSDPLVDKSFPYTAIPEHADTHTDGRGPQSGYNICNSTTENQDSLCQTGFINHLDDFCLFAPPTPNSTIGDSEGIEVAWCTKKGHGTRLIPEGALQGVQLVQSPGYIEIVGFIDQTKLNVQDGDFGGELDSGGQDGRGNPIGGLMYTNAFPSNNGDNSTYQQGRHWTFFIGSNTFCAKICDDTQPNAEGLCQHIYDRVGCAYNAPNNAPNGTFQACQGADMVPVGQYVSDGITTTWTQPAQETIPLGTIPYTPTPAASSNCVTYTSASLYTDLASVGVTSSPANPSATGSGSSGSGSGAGASQSGSGAGASATGSTSNAGSAIGISLVSSFFGVLLSMFLFY
ncbi:hypothetical protein GYMLUDRAFT_77020 [Collybiopsis luxurians FD-317 M1]|uniref:Macrofage activating glycoprotein n=1 Tax=Collybiopsis luxurians FD-317 M1 TaxID=944289 RepID=A0A0D0BXH7_9AGAR|nr:hypothetical protein GYMLUDRAFT_77020 [Collybiopsis luxurians FD-317 M1]